MSLRASIPIFAIQALIACSQETTAPTNPQPPPVGFGQIAVRIDGGEWIFLQSIDSTVARFDRWTGRVSIEAINLILPTRATRFYLGIRLCSLRSGAFSFADPTAGVAALWVAQIERSRPRADPAFESFVSIGAVTDSLIIEDYALGAPGYIRGRFHFVAQAASSTGRSQIKGYFDGFLGWNLAVGCG